MRVYLDSSAVLKRVIDEPESDALIEAVDRYYRDRASLVSSSLAWIEVARALRKLEDARFSDVGEPVDDALAGVLEMSINPQVVALARRTNPNILRSLDAIHLASALIVDADAVLTYDVRLEEACRHNGLRVTMPGRE
jgi:predicted nucleic acid-binding protein